MNVDQTSYAASLYKNAAAYQTTQASFSLTGSYLEVTGSTGGSYYAAEDSAEISDLAKEMLERIRNLDIFKLIFPDNDPRQQAKSLDEVESDFLSDFNDFSSAFGSMQSMMGFSFSASFTMGLNGTGGVTVDGSDSAAAEKIQAGVSGNSTMVARFAVMAARAALADAGYTVDGFSDAYASDPVSAIQDNIDALKERLLGFRTVASGGSMQYGFVRQFSMEIQFSSYTASYQTAGSAGAA